MVSVSSADAKSMKRADIKVAARKAVTKAKAKLARRGIKARAVGPYVGRRCARLHQGLPVGHWGAGR
jgi:hypothetical protein